MSTPGNPPHCLFFTGCIHPPGTLSSRVSRAIEDLMGSLDWVSVPMLFSATDHYEEEMGEELYRTFFFSRELSHSPDQLVDLKLKSLEIEERFSVSGKRIVNLDPGYLNSYQVVIATFKNFSHRIYMGRGVYAHLEYLFQGKKPVSLRWTYPDFREEGMRRIFVLARSVYKQKWEVQDLNL